MWNVEMEKKNLIDKYKKTKTLINAEKEYVRIWEETWLNENKALLNKKLAGLQAEIIAIDKKIADDDDNITEVTCVFTRLADAMDRRTRTWSIMYDKDISAMDEIIMTMETEQERLDESQILLEAHAVELQTTIDEIDERQRNRALLKEENNSQGTINKSHNSKIQSAKRTIKKKFKCKTKK